MFYLNIGENISCVLCNFSVDTSPGGYFHVCFVPVHCIYPLKSFVGSKELISGH